MKENAFKTHFFFRPTSKAELYTTYDIFILTYIYIKILGIIVTKAEFVEYKSHNDYSLGSNKTLCHCKLD